MRSWSWIASLALLAINPGVAAGAPDASTASAPAGAALTERARSMGAVWNGVVAAPDGRLFAVLPRLANPTGPSLVQVTDRNGPVPYPSAAWNGDGTLPDRAAMAFVGLSAIHLGPDGSMWAVDTGSPGFGKAAVPGGTRLLRIDLGRNEVTRILTLPPDVLRPRSAIGDIRFNGGHAYVTDSGAPGLIVLDLVAATFRRVLDRDPALTAQRPITVDGEVLKGPDGRPVLIHADQMEVSPDGRSLYVQPPCGPMSRVDTALLDDPQVPPDRLAAAVRFWYDTPSLGGTAIEPDGTLLLDDVEDDGILRLSPARELRLVARDPRLHWAGAPFLAPDGTMTVPVPQLDRAAPFRHGRAQLQFPILMLTLRPTAPPPAPPAGGVRR